MPTNPYEHPGTEQAALGIGQAPTATSGGNVFGGFGVPPPPAPTRPGYLAFYNGVGLTQYEYNSLLRSYMDLSQAYGFNLSGGMRDYLIKQGVAPQEFQLRLNAWKMMNDNQTLLDAFQHVVGRTLGAKDRLN